MKTTPYELKMQTLTDKYHISVNQHIKLHFTHKNNSCFPLQAFCKYLILQPFSKYDSKLK